MSLSIEPVYCVRCKSELHPYDSFCPKCGLSQLQSEGETQLRTPPPVVIAPPPPPPVNAYAPQMQSYRPPEPQRVIVIHSPPSVLPGCLGIIGGIVGASAGLVQILWGTLALIVGLITLPFFGILGAMVVLIVWLPVHGVLGVIKGASSR